MTKQLKLLLISLITILLVLGLFFLMPKKAPKTSDKLQIVTTFYPVYEFTKAVVGNEAEVSLLIEAGTEVHDFEPSSQVIANIQSADALVYVNENMEVWIDDISQAIDLKKVKLVKATANMTLMEGQESAHEEEEDHEEHDHDHELDPHVWLSPKLAMTMVETIRDSLSQDFPEKAKIFSKNAVVYIEQLRKLDKEYSLALDNAKQKDFVTQHAAFGYLAKTYGLHQVAIAGISAEREPSVQRLAELAQYVKDNHIRYIYFEENASSKVAKTLADEVGVKTAVLNPLESLTQEQQNKGENYFSVMRDNLASLRLTTDE